ncbi:MAG: PAS domain S-box protein, partial [Candidatus Aminicenantales bacterium]
MLSPETYRQVFNNIREALVYLDRGGIIREANRKAAELFGGAKKDLIGRRFTDIGIFSPKQ